MASTSCDAGCRPTDKWASVQRPLHPLPSGHSPQSHARSPLHSAWTHLWPRPRPSFSAHEQALTAHAGGRTEFGRRAGGFSWGKLISLGRLLGQLPGMGSREPSGAWPAICTRVCPCNDSVWHLHGCTLINPYHRTISAHRWT